MTAAYQIAERRDSRALARFFSGEGQALLPMLELIEQAEMAVDELIGEVGRAAVEPILTLSAHEIAGPKQQGRRDRQGRPVGWHGYQEGRVVLSDRKLKVDYSVGFASTEQAFMKWCEDLVNQLWGQGDRVE